MNIRNACLMGLVLVAGAFGLILAGCDTTDTPESAITIDPPSKGLTMRWETVMFTASSSGTNATSGLVLPLVWSVSDSSLGIIKASEGLTAIYESTGKIGNNTVTVRDQADKSGVAVVNQTVSGATTNAP